MKSTQRMVPLVVILLCSLFASLVPYSEPAVAGDSAHTVTLNAGEATLKINQNPWDVIMVNSRNEVQFQEARPPAFLLDGTYRSVEHVVSVQEQSDRRAELSVAVEGGHRGKVIIETLTPNAFRIQIIPEQQEVVEGIRGTAYLKTEEQVYGFGETWNGQVAQRGQSLTLWDEQGTPDKCAYMPFYVTTENYIYFLDYGGLVEFDVGKTHPGRIEYTAPASEFTINLMSGRSIPAAVEHYLDVVGKPRIPPRWAFKPWFWLMGPPDEPMYAGGARYKGHEVVEAAEQYRELDIPVGVTWFEPNWQTERSTFDVSPEFTSDLPGLIDTLNAMGIKVLAWTVPYTRPSASNWETVLKNGYLVGKPDSIEYEGQIKDRRYRHIDFTNPEAKAYWQEQIEKGIKAGFHGFKMDAGQRLGVHAKLQGGKLGKHYHNTYALWYNETFSEVLQKHYGDDFLTVPRAAYVGSGKYINFKWPGDLTATFEYNGLPASVYSTLALGFAGVPFLATDIGGFNDRPPRELVWVRWAQFGAMLPGMETLSMPWWYSDRAMQHYRKLSWLHTEMIPYWMTLAREAHETGAPLVRPLVWNYQEDQKTWEIKDQFTVGEQLLVAPITGKDGRRDVYFPEGKWYYFWDDSRFVEGPVTRQWDGDLYEFPLYVRAGAILPLEVTSGYTALGWEEFKDHLTLAIWPDPEGRSEFTLRDEHNTVHVTVEAGTANDRNVISWGETSQDIILRVHIPEGTPRNVSMTLERNEQSLTEYDSRERFLAENTAGWYFTEGQGKLYARIPAAGKSGEVTYSVAK